MLSNHRSFTRFAVALLLLVFSMSPIFASPSAETAADSADGSGQTAAVPRRIAGAGRGLIQSIGVLGMFPGAMDAMVAVGVTDQGMGDFYELLDPDHENRIRLGKSPGAEELAAANPDMVFLRRYLADSLGAPLETLGIPVEYLDLENPEDFDDDIRLIGSVLGQDERAEQILAWFDARQAALEDAVPPADADSPRVLLLQVSGSPEEPRLSVAPGEWIQNTQIRLAGAQPLGSEAALEGGWAEVSFEQIAAWNPDYIFLISYRSDGVPYRMALESLPLWGELDAVANRRIYAAPADFYSWMQADTRWILGAEWLVRILHPGVLDNSLGADMEGSLRDFFSELYGIDEETFDRELAPRISGDLLVR
jgi:iron complex transport system substrate-binding protein